MTPLEAVAIGLAGVLAGGINAVVGTGTLITFPVLVASGLPPVSATMSNAVGLVAGGLAGSWGYRRELAGQRRRLAQLAPASLLGAVTGAWLLLHLPEDAFETIVPGLLVLALALVIAQPWLQRRIAARHAADGRKPGRRHLAATLGGAYAAGTYGGYFTAAQGVLLVGVLGSLLPDSPQRLNALKNVLVTGVNLVAAGTYVIVAAERISWPAVGLIAGGSLLGGLLGARVGRRLPGSVLRAVIVVFGIVAIVAIVTS